MLNTNHVKLLTAAFESLLGSPTRGNMTFVRCLAPGVVAELVSNPSFSPDGWVVRAVSDQRNDALRSITADQAVELREDKADAVLLIVDVERAGAGMDGIYNASREIGEKILFAAAGRLAMEEISHGAKGFTQKALAKARSLSRHVAVSPWREFDYLCRVTETSDSAGAALAHIGLWPVATEGDFDPDDLDHSVRLLDRLLPTSRAGKASPETRVEGLLLVDPTSDQLKQLIRFVREADRLPRLDALLKLQGMPELWLNAIRPGIFSQAALQGIKLESWRNRSGKPLAWSGLSVDEENRLLLTLSINDDNPKARAKLVVQWKTLPEGLPKNTAEFHVSLVAGDDVLAEKDISHSGKDIQKVTFTQDDFAELDEQSRYDATIKIRSLGQDRSEAESEDFLITFGDVKSPLKSGVGRPYRSMAEGAIHSLANVETFRQVSLNPANPQHFGQDSKGFITFRHSDRTAKIFCPSLLKQLSDKWCDQKGAPGRWRVAVRADGTAAKEAEFVPFEFGDQVTGWDRVVNASRGFASHVTGSFGWLNLIYSEVPAIEEFVKAWLPIIENGDANLALVHTLEVCSQSGRTLGLIVLPNHPLRMAWHQAYDTLLMRSRYEDGIAAGKIIDALKGVDGAHCPAFLPGLVPGKTFVFADMLGFHAVAMVYDDDPEPKSTVSVMTRLLFGKDEVNASQTGEGAAKALALEMSRYLQLHPDYRLLKLHALRAGDGASLARAMGHTLRQHDKATLAVDEAGDGVEDSHLLCFSLELFPATSNSEMVGRFIAGTVERKRAGAGGAGEDDRWILESCPRPGGVSLPRLSWAKRTECEPHSHAHMAIAFDTFESRVQALPRAELSDAAALEVYGLINTPRRSFQFSPHPYWRTWVPLEQEGEKHPAARNLSERLAKLHSAVLVATSRNIGGGPASWPVLVTEIAPEKEDALRTLHQLCDWVISADRHAGVEYFDSPRDNTNVYDAYVIDCVPEREDLGFLQLITSTSNFDEIVNLLDASLGEMGLSSSPRNCRFLLDELKSISGRLAMRLAGSGNVVQELIAVALAHHNCRRRGQGISWLSLDDGFFIPLDDVPSLFGEQRVEANNTGNVLSAHRADLLYVTVPKRGGFRFTFVEIKFRRYLKTARSPDLSHGITHQLETSLKRWEALFGPDTLVLEQAVRRGELARILRFYAAKGRRHSLSDDAYLRVMKETERMVRDGREYQLPNLREQERYAVGFVFCPEYRASIPTAIASGGPFELWLFGPDAMPEHGGALAAPLVNDVIQLDSENPKRESVIAAKDAGQSSQDGAILSELMLPGDGRLVLESGVIQLGIKLDSEEPVEWTVSIKGNPHLMLVGLPGMGKTTCLINVCQQLIEQSITPIVFSYHDDIDKQLSKITEGKILPVKFSGLGFNPMQVIGEGPVSHIDNVSMLRDIFSAIFPDLGDIQLGRLREALKRSYLDLGWGGDTNVRPLLPSFQAFFDILKSEAKPDKGLLNRLSELDDYGFFKGTEGARSLLEGDTAAVIQIHGSANETMQRAFATFVLHNLYQAMFQRGIQNRITHAIIFDEAHKAAKLKLIPTMIKECRKYGIAFVVASQEAKDFDPSMFNGIANYAALRLNETDAKVMARIMASSDRVALYTDRIKQLPKYQAFYYGEGCEQAIQTELS